MVFGAWYFAFLLGLVPALAALYAWGLRRRRRALGEFVALAIAPRLVAAVDWRRRNVKSVLLVSAIAFMIIAIMQPQWGRESGDTQRHGRDVYLLLDVSRSMLAEDAEPSRLEAAKAAIVDLVDELRSVGGHRLGLVVFAGRATLQSPLTLDYGFFLDRLRLASTESVDLQGSAIGSAVRKTLYGFGEIDPTYTDFIVISDGENHEGGTADAARDAAGEGVAIHVVGVGDPATGARIPIEIGEGRRQYLRFGGEDVISVMRESQLREMARMTGGAYVQARTAPIDLAQIFDDHISNKAQRDVEAGEGERKADRYAWFVVVALALLAAEMLLAERRLQPGEA